MYPREVREDPLIQKIASLSDDVLSVLSPATRDVYMYCREIVRDQETQT